MYKNYLGIKLFGTRINQKLIFEKLEILKKDIDNLVFYLVIAGTDTSQIQGISAAGLNSRERRKTALADAEFLLFGPSLVHEYKLGSLIIKHYDLYRINDEKELHNIGIYEDNSDEIILIEWPEKMKKNNNNNIIDLSFEYEDEFKKRFLNISSNNKVSFLDEFKKS